MKLFSRLKHNLFLIVGLVFLMLALAFTSSRAIAAENKPSTVFVEVLMRADCVHCQAEKAFFKDLAKERSDFTVHWYDVTQPEGKALWERLAAREKVAKVTPITLIGETVIVGFDKPETTGKTVTSLIDKAKQSSSVTLKEYLAADKKQSKTIVQKEACDESGESLCGVAPPTSAYYVAIPFIGAVNVVQYSLPILSFILGFIDGFNPCAMWVLVTFLIVLAQVGSRRKMWLFAGSFIVAEAIMYYLILTVWATAWDFVGLDRVVTPIVGALAIGGGIFFLYEWKSAGDACKVIGAEKRQKTSQRIRRLVEQRVTLATIVGIVMLALSVNIIEFACSIGIPQAYTKILDLNALPFLARQFNMMVYILAYMVDDFVVFALALYSFEKIGLTSKYSKVSNFVGGILMVILGLLLIFKPEFLHFG